jgi:tetratricopeptide (TPR) repeat protein
MSISLRRRPHIRICPEVNRSDLILQMIHALRDSYFPKPGMAMSTSRSKTGTRKTTAARVSYAAGDLLQTQWQRWHRGDREPFPEERLIAKLSKGDITFASSVNGLGGPAELCAQLQTSWKRFHQGKFLEAVELGANLGPLGAVAANKAVGVYALYPKPSDHSVLQRLEQAIERGEAATQALPDYPNAHYTLALVLGRYSQRISILRALAEGLGGRVRSHLDRTLELEPEHAEAHVALGLYHAEIVAKLGVLAARLTYGASAAAALRCFDRAIELTPDSPIAMLEFARGLLLLDASAHRERALELLKRAVDCEVEDAMERLDAKEAQRTLAALKAN